MIADPGPSRTDSTAAATGSVLAIGSVALDAVETQFGGVDGVIGGSAVFFSAAASLLTRVRVVGVIGDDYPVDELRFLQKRGVDLEGLSRQSGKSFFWAGRYHDGFATRETLATRLGVFASFDPVVPPAHVDSKIVFLGNIDPALQLGVLDQVSAPRLVAADTMNYWIERTPDALMEVLARIDVLLVNDEEAIQLSGRSDLAAAARWIGDRGTRVVVVKQGANGATLFADGWSVSCPAHVVSALVDPTGAGDAFAGGFLGWLAASGACDPPSGPTPGDLREALVYGSAMGSYAVEAFSIDRFRDLGRDEVDGRVRALSSGLSRRSATGTVGAGALEHG